MLFVPSPRDISAEDTGSMEPQRKVGCNFCTCNKLPDYGNSSDEARRPSYHPRCLQVGEIDLFHVIILFIRRISIDPFGDCRGRWRVSIFTSANEASRRSSPLRF